jgi:HEAT repeat protein
LSNRSGISRPQSLPAIARKVSCAVAPRDRDPKRECGVCIRTVLACCALLVAASGCSQGTAGASLDAAVKKLFTPKRSPQQYMLIAVSDPDPDVRRSAVAKVAESGERDQEWAIKGYIAIALLESNPHVRCAAVRALGCTQDARAAETCLKILNHRDYPPDQVYPPDDLCRWDATAVLGTLAAEPLSDELRGAALKTLLDRLRNDPGRNVRTAAADGLRHFTEPEALRGLIAGLRDPDFAVVHECEQSLAWLTGVTHDCDAYLWEQWLAAHPDDAFARGGQLPESRQPPYEGRWGKLMYDTKQFFEWAFPGRKE